MIFFYFMFRVAECMLQNLECLFLLFCFVMILVDISGVNVCDAVCDSNSYHSATGLLQK